MDRIRKFIEFGIKEVENEDRTISAIASTGEIDRDGDILEPKGWKLKNFRQNPVILWGHTYRGTEALPIGTASEIKVEDDKLKFKLKFIEKEIYPFADTVYQMYKKRYLRTFSVGFIPIKSEEIENDEDKKGMFRGRRYTSQELLEISGCPVPSNAGALAERDMEIVMAKSFGLKIDEKPLVNFDYGSRLLHHDEKGNIITEKLIACMAAVLGARGGLDLKFDEKVSIYDHLKKHYDSLKWTKETPEFKEYTESELREMFDDVWFEELGDIVTCELDNREELERIKSGRVLSEKNRSLVKKCVDVLNELYNASEPEPKRQIETNENQQKLNKLTETLKDLRQEVEV